jgi:hypothetical protein
MTYEDMEEYRYHLQRQIDALRADVEQLRRILTVHLREHDA